MAKPISEIPLEAIEEEGTPQARGKSVLKKLIILGGAFLVLLAGGVAGAAYFLPAYLPEALQFFGNPQTKGAHGAGKEKRHQEEQGFIYNLDPFIVNLADPDEPRYLKIRISLEGNQKEQNEEFSKRIPQIKDTVLSILGKKTYSELLDTAGKEKLKEELIKSLNPKLAEFKFKAVYFTELVIQ